MRSDWKDCTLGDLVTFQRGHDLPKSKMNKGKYPVVGSNGIIGYHDEYTTEAPSITVGRSGNVGKPFIYYGRTWSHNTSLYIKDFKGNDPIFIYYFLQTLDLANYAGGSAVPTLNRNHIHTLDVSVPRDVSLQKEIGKCLKLLDDKIKVNTEINENLTEQIRTLCDAWLNEYVPFGGVCPDDWELTPLASFAHFISGYSYKGSELQTSSIAMATIKNFDRKGGFKLDGYKEIIPSSKLKPEHHAELFDTLVAHTDLTQNAEVIGNAEPILSFSGYDDIIFSMDVVKVIPDNPAISKFLIAAMLQTRQFKAHCLGYVNGTTVLHLSKKALPEYSLMLPHDFTVLQPLDDAVSSMYQRMALNIDESVQLATLRDSLLPKLMSGEIDVSTLDL